jgi:ribosomal protein S8
MKKTLKLFPSNYTVNAARLPVDTPFDKRNDDKYLRLFLNLNAEEKVPGNKILRPLRPQFGNVPAHFCGEILLAQRNRDRFYTCRKNQRSIGIAEVLLQCGFITSFREYETMTSIELKYFQEQGAIISANAITRPNERVFWNRMNYAEYLPKKVGFAPVVVCVETEKGIMSHMRAYKEHLPGEALCRFW